MEHGAGHADRIPHDAPVQLGEGTAGCGLQSGPEDLVTEVGVRLATLAEVRLLQTGDGELGREERIGVRRVVPVVVEGVGGRTRQSGCVGGQLA